MLEVLDRAQQGHEYIEQACRRHIGGFFNPNPGDESGVQVEAYRDPMDDEWIVQAGVTWLNEAQNRRELLQVKIKVPRYHPKTEIAQLLLDAVRSRIFIPPTVKWESTPPWVNSPSLPEPAVVGPPSAPEPPRVGRDLDLGPAAEVRAPITVGRVLDI